MRLQRKVGFGLLFVLFFGIVTNGRANTQFPFIGAEIGDRFNFIFTASENGTVVSKANLTVVVTNITPYYNNISCEWDYDPLYCTPEVGNAWIHYEAYEHNGTYNHTVYDGGRQIAAGDILGGCSLSSGAASEMFISKNSPIKTYSGNCTIGGTGVWQAQVTYDSNGVLLQLEATQTTTWGATRKASIIREGYIPLGILLLIVAIGVAGVLVTIAVVRLVRRKRNPYGYKLGKMGAYHEPKVKASKMKSPKSRPPSEYMLQNLGTQKTGQESAEELAKDMNRCPSCGAPVTKAMYKCPKCEKLLL